MRVKCTVSEDREVVGGGAGAVYRTGGFVSSHRNGHEVDVVEVSCSRCGHATRSFGSTDASIKRCLVMLREESLRGEHNFYAAPPV